MTQRTSPLVASLAIASLSVLASACVSSHYTEDPASPGHIISGFAYTNDPVEVHIWNYSTSTWHHYNTINPNPTPNLSYQGDGLHPWSIDVPTLRPNNISGGMASFQFRQNGSPMYVYDRDLNTADPGATSPHSCVIGHLSNFSWPADYNILGGMWNINNANVFLECGGGLTTTLRLDVS